MKNYSRAKKIVQLYRILANAISVLIHPLLIPTYLILCISYFAPMSITPLNSVEGRTFLIGLFFLATFFLPLLLLALYLIIKDNKWTAQSFLMENSKDRVFPFLIVATFYSVLLYFIRRTPQFNDVILIDLFCITFSILAVALISNFWKISAHAVGISGMIVMLAVINNKMPDSILFFPIIGLILLSGGLMSARLYLNAHTPLQVAYGALLGLIVGGFSYIFI